VDQNKVPTDDVAARIAQETLSRRGAAYADEVRRLLDAALGVMHRCGTDGRPRVADIVAEAGLSNEAFYRHFPSKDALVAALLDDGAARLRSYLTHQMEKAPAPSTQVRRWVEGVLSQTDPGIAETTLAVLYNAGEGASGRHFASGALATLLQQPLAELGSDDPALASSFAAHAVLGVLADHLWQRTRPSPDEVDRLVELCLALSAPRSRSRRTARATRGRGAASRQGR
jgi:AcrR family transcriptional regulator